MPLRTRPCALQYGIVDVPPFPGQERFLLFTHMVVVPFIDGGQIVLNSWAASPELRTASAFLAGLLTEPGSGRQSESSARRGFAGEECRRGGSR